jgi:hypothetical protein
MTGSALKGERRRLAGHAGDGAIVRLWRLGRERMRELSMTKTWHLIQETVQNAKHPFRQADNRSAKSKKNRYERRKVRELLRLGDWAGEPEVEA